MKPAVGARSWINTALMSVAIFGSAHGARRGDDRATAILRERYARGEIDKPEFDERMRHLKD